MELDDLKAKWQSNKEYPSLLKEKNMEQIQSILKEKSSSILIEVKKKYENVISVVLVGLLANIVLSPFLPWLLGVDGPVYSLPGDGDRGLSLLVVVSLGILIVFFYWIKYVSLDTTMTSQNLKSGIIEQIHNLKKGMKQEIFFVIAVFIMMFIAARTTSKFTGYGDFWDIFHLDILLALSIAIACISYFVFSRIKRYKHNIRELHTLLNELKEA